MPFDPGKPYDDLPLLPPEADIETRVILKKCTTARAAVAELKVAGELIPNQDVLIRTFLLLEAEDSSKIENIVTTTDELFRQASLQEQRMDPATKEALNYRAALYEGYMAILDRPLSTMTTIEVCRTIKGIALDIRTTPGTTLKNAVTGELIYTPPEGEQVIREKLANWEQFIHDVTDIDPLVQMAVMHYQFEAIHPFIDGNGRTGRILNILFLIHIGLLTLPVLYLSHYILRNRAEYYHLLNGVTREGDWQSWILYMLNAVEITAHATTGKIRAIRDLMDHTSAYIREKLPKIYSYELVELIFLEPYCRIASLTEAGIAKRQAASTYLKQLVAIGVLEEEKQGREKAFRHPKYQSLLESDENGFTPYGAKGQ